MPLLGTATNNPAEPSIEGTMEPSKTKTVEIRRIPSNSGAEVIKHITKLINDVYLAAESDLWVHSSWQRTTETDMAKLVASSQLVGAYVNGHLVGCARTEKLGKEEEGFGMLAVEDSQRGTSLGRDLVQFVEQESRQKGFKRMQLEILTPKGWHHPSKEFLKAWYGRLGYEKTRVGSIEEASPGFSKLLATPCDLVVYEKALWGGKVCSCCRNLMLQ